MKQMTSYNRVAGYLNKIFDLLNEEFFESALSRPTITIQSTPRAYGHFSLREDTWVSKLGGTHELIMYIIAEIVLHLIRYFSRGHMISVIFVPFCFLQLRLYQVIITRSNHFFTSVISHNSTAGVGACGAIFLRLRGCPEILPDAPC